MQSMRATNLLPYLKHVQAPTLVLFGQQDGVVPVTQGRLAAQHIPQAQLALIDQCGHYPMYEQPERYLAHLNAFLAA